MVWDRGLTFEKLLEALLTYKKGLRYLHELGRLPAKKRATLRNINILLTALTNGLSISEAIECYSRFVETGEREHIVEASRSQGKVKPCVIPPFIDDVDTKIGDVKVKKYTIIGNTVRRYNVNTHTLKKAFTRYIKTLGIPTSITKPQTPEKAKTNIGKLKTIHEKLKTT